MQIGQRGGAQEVRRRLFSTRAHAGRSHGATVLIRHGVHVIRLRRVSSMHICIVLGQSVHAPSARSGERTRDVSERLTSEVIKALRRVIAKGSRV